IEVRDQTPSSSDGGEELAPAACPDLLTIGVRVQITTDDGGLDEVFDAELRTTSGTEASLHLPLIPSRLRGSFAVEVLQPHQTIEQVRLAATLSPDGCRGSITGTLATSQGENGSAESVTFGRWPAGEPLDEEWRIAPATLPPRGSACSEAPACSGVPASSGAALPPRGPASRAFLPSGSLPLRARRRRPLTKRRRSCCRRPGRGSPGASAPRAPARIFRGPCPCAPGPPPSRGGSTEPHP